MNNKAVLLWLAMPLVTAGCTTMEAQIRSSGSMGQPDAQYANTAYELIQLDNQAGKLAVSKASDARVQTLASTLMTQAAAFTPGLKSALDVEGVKPSSNLPQADAAELQKLSSLSGPAFDHQFVADELAMHKRAVAAMQQEDASTKDGALRTQVEAQLPAVQTNLSTLQDLSNEYNGKTPSQG